MPPSATRRRRALVAAATAVAVVAVARPAAAHDISSGPTTFHIQVDEISDVERLQEAVTRLEASPAAVLTLEATPGHEVEVLGYAGEPFVQVGPEGTVEVNAASSTAMVAELVADDGTAPSPSSATDDARWVETGAAATISWHDHRIHYMAPEAPDATAGEVVQEWEIDLVLDGEPVSIRGSLTYDPSVDFEQYQAQFDADGNPIEGTTATVAAADRAGTGEDDVAGVAVAVAILGAVGAAVGARTWLSRRERA